MLEFDKVITQMLTFGLNVDLNCLQGSNHTLSLHMGFEESICTSVSVLGGWLEKLRI